MAELTVCVPFFTVTVYSGDVWLPRQMPLRTPVFVSSERPSGRDGAICIESYTLSGRKRIGRSGTFR